MKKLSKILGLLGISIAVLAVIIFAPTFKLETSKMLSKEGNYCTIYYEPQDANMIDDLMCALENVTNTLSDKDFIDNTKKIGIYIYPDSNTLHIKKYGLLGNLINSNQYIGDNVFTDVIVASPNAPGSTYTAQDVINTATHEYAHTLVYRINSTTPKILSEGLSDYLSGWGKPTSKFTKLPPIDYTYIGNPTEFKAKGLDPYAYTYIEYLNKKYGMEKVIDLTLHPYQYEDILGTTQEQVYADWCNYLKANYLI